MYNYLSLKFIKYITAKAYYLLMAMFFIAVNVSANESLTFGHSEKIFSKTFNEERTLLIKLPEGYENAKNTQYPVFYTLDGTTHFHRVAGTLQWLSDTANVIPQHIVVGLVADNSNRLRDAHPFKTKRYKEGRIAPAADFSHFLTDELVPYIDKKYRTHPMRTLAGHSAAGRSTVHSLTTTKDVFQAFIIMSPVFSESERSISFLQQTAKKLESAIKAPTFVFTSIGFEPNNQNTFDRIIDGFKRYAPDNLEWESQIYPQETHMSNPSKTLHNAMQAISVFRGWSVPPKLTHKGLSAIKLHYQKLSEKFGYNIPPVEGLLINMAYDYLGLKQSEQAIEAFQLATKLYPLSANAHDSLADAYESADLLQQAMAVQKIAVKLAETQQSSNIEQVKQHLATIEEKINNS
ncbi:MAG: hypothetical protein HRT52_06030 [Colwellia sp.]|nr:hypothetical protein [Colwellia sp.]